MDALIVDGVRTPRGRAGKKGALDGIAPIELLKPLYGAMEERVPGAGAQVEDVVLGCVHQVGEQGANIAKISALYAGLPESISGATVNRFCASGLEALATAASRVAAGGGPVLAGGVESLSRVPMFSDRGAWFADAKVARATRFVHMGVSADLVATLEGFIREELDAYAARSHARAQRAQAEGRWSRSLVPVRNAAGDVVLDRDECPRDGVTVASLGELEPGFGAIGAEGADATCLARYPQLDAIRHVHHPGSSPALADGASLLLVASESHVSKMGARPRARVLSFASASVEPALMLTGNVEASRRALLRAGIAARDVDVFEVNESFAAVPLHYGKHMEVDPERLNPSGGAIALGHPLGATGGMLVLTAIDALERADAKIALVSICGGAGIALAMVVERL